ncbi:MULTISPECIES: GNAT family N-acetyltransferase [Microbacterium]|uniref:GNAT family N-acetyltransferase n=1 Tax=Microbacterium hominis TaxID=162426 RepID=A0A2K9DB97_9MICO|nr:MULTISPECIES: hypothetical protein [Microbacterium]AUG30835.1 hypothetical protein CXR34_16115 [Microbacterium hominis]
MAFVIREPQPADAAAVAELHVATWKEAYAHLLPDGYFSAEYVDRRHRMWRQVLAERRDGMVIRVAEVGEDIVGFAWVGPGEGLDGEEPPRDRLLYAKRVSIRDLDP